LSQADAVQEKAEDSLRSEQFHRLAARKNAVSLALTLVIMGVYYGFIFLLAFNKELVGSKLTANVTLGIPLGIGVILVSILATGVYVAWANRSYDAMADELRQKWGK
jgi:uncharacterized membrane protein (DUF485 family)